MPRCSRLAVTSAALLIAGAARADVVISAKPTANMSCTGGVCTPTAEKAVLNVGDLANMLASGDTAVKSTSQSPDIEIDAKLFWADTSRLTLDSYHSIFFKKPVVVGSGAMTVATNDGGAGGDFTFSKKGSVEFKNISSNLVINGNSYALANSVVQIRKLVHRGDGAHYIALAREIDATNYNDGPISFAPDLEGLGNTISNLSITDQTSGADVGLFDESATVRDVGLINVTIVGTGSQQRVGAIAGTVSGTIVHCFVTGMISATGTQSNVGGLTGANEGTIADSYSGASITASAENSRAGGLVGINAAGEQGQWNGVIEESYSTGDIVGADTVMTGGLTGYNYGGAIRNSYAFGAATGGNASFVGGLIGANANSDSANPTISESYSIGAVSGGADATLGGLIGEDLAQTGNANNYWDLDTSGIGDASKGAGNIPNDPGLTGLSDAQLKAGLPSGFDKKVWKESAKLNNGYPYLIDNPPPK